ncbi:signal peptidase II [Buchnera aphidicola (Muscaphis stroyani)]|uniref:Lipoprotein signal peptidase n=1 Tax=Buchnera aphidicola (Muscaphis stroyani) TaxID=1241869 RepID=A0A4D6Y4I0_9GAMM|nr:signal peptidase II [Buchnera aphidicola]QCI24247.1 signal peptidase II [Buchnera aphidicola (Muscaphis stroyani)]
MKNKINSIYIIILIFSIDLFSKNWIINHLKIHEKKIISSILNIFYVKNYGAAFNMLSNQGGWQIWFLSFVSIISILIIIKIVVNTKNEYKNQIIPYTLIISGAIGNLSDRIFRGFVIDFIDLHIKNFHFPTFNIADFSIFIGAIVIGIRHYFFTNFD